MKLYISRHPQSLANVSNINGTLDSGLTLRGKWQMKRTLEYYKSRHLNCVITSPAYRCRVFAEALAQSHNCDLIIDPNVRERDYGDLENQRGYLVHLLGMDENPLNGESVLDVANRSKLFSETISHAHGNMVLVSHGLFLKALLANFLAMDLQTCLKTTKFSNCSVSLLDYDQHRIEYLNQRTHLGNPVNKVHIFGSWASGKTTFAKELSERFDIPLYSLDELKYPKSYDKPVPAEKRIERLDELTSMDRWVTEGSWTDYAQYAFYRADLLIYLRMSLPSNLTLAIKREIFRKKPEGVSFYKLFSELIKYYFNDNPVSQRAHDEICKSYSSKCIVNPDMNSVEFLEDLIT